MKISVCMATYNGCKYVNDQISSILVQLRADDELIIVDDKSTDITLQIIDTFNDSRIKIFKNEVNLGVTKNFEKAINNATGNLIFLSDQDDVWLPNKVEKILEVFQKYPDITLVLSDAQIIDSEGQVTANSFFKLRGKFVADPLSNFIKNKYHGCTLAFRREMLEVFLPFPDDISMHDIWIGIVNGIYGKAFYIDEPLIQHRRHNSNTSVGIFSNLVILQMLKWRFALAKNIVNLLLKHRNRKIKT
ncbi:glycosyltransferase family 2 protein [Dolichospermum compactum]|uniref:Family 2 glycosyl transferase n=1 Tax=Dolichospermum compactum NIES-806 TaxID=1973481 RepID=A0A1Z4V054_9CYAN|nr:glycosyltransferase family 2 protein [Dolichospermum compactum]BAZ84814.1 family 2 glycosyl transferase [Dolichospermum compactum NIES-806]